VDLLRMMTLNDNKIDYIHWDDPNKIVDRLRLLEPCGHNDHDNEILLIIKEFREVDLIIKSDYYKLTSFYTHCSVDIAMPINKFELSLGRGSELHYQWRGLQKLRARFRFS